MADIFHEVDEEVRRERLKKLWDRYSIYIVALAVLLIAGVGGWRGYDYLQGRKAAEAGAAFEAALALAEAGKHQEAADAFARVGKDGTPGYRTLARLREAAELAATDVKTAVAAFDAVAADGAVAQTLRDLASVRSGFLLLDTASYDDMRGRLEPLTAANRAFRHSARELLALSAWRAEDMATTRRWSDMILNDGETPASIRARIDVLMALVPATAKG